MDTTQVNMVTVRDADRFESVLSDVLSTVSFLPEGGNMRSDDIADAGEALAALFAGSTVDTFDSAGVLTRNRGLVVKLASGAEFQLTIVRSK